jgi:hypothetical protein
MAAIEAPDLLALDGLDAYFGAARVRRLVHGAAW